MCVVDPVSGRELAACVAIREYDAIYRAVGVTAARFEQWMKAYGVDSLGVGHDGALLAPGYPVFSKVAWLYVDQVDLSHDETVQLIRECELAMASADDPAAKEALDRIRHAALFAIEKSARLRLTHP